MATGLPQWFIPGILLNAAWPNPQCPPGYRKIQTSGTLESGGLFSGVRPSQSFSCMIQPANATPWTQNTSWVTLATGPIEYCDFGYRFEITEQYNSLYSTGVYVQGQIRTRYSDDGDCQYRAN